jgi:post-segregation antitoxin (ccd killing protein)
MKTNVMIRIDEGLAHTAKELDLNFSKIAEDALKLAVEEETKPFGITKTSQIIVETELMYNVRAKKLGVSFVVTNASDENIISDRVNYLLIVTDQESFTDLPHCQGIQVFKGTVFERRTLHKGVKDGFSDELIPSSELASRLAQVTYEDSKNLRWVVYPEFFADTRKKVLQAEYAQKMDDKGFFPIPRPLKTF